MKKLRLSGVVALVLILAATTTGVVLAVFSLPYGVLDYSAFKHVYTQAPIPLELAIDANPTNGAGPCDPVDSQRTVYVGDTYQVAICLMNQPEAPQGFLARVIYDKTLNVGPECAADPANPGPGEIACAAPNNTGAALDDNPDANAGTTTWPNAAGETLGGGWDCSSFGVLFPQGDDANTDYQADAIISCYSLAGPFDLSSSGALAMITFQATNAGNEVLTFGPDSVVSGAESGQDIGSCGRSPDVLIPCPGAQITKVVSNCLFEDNHGNGTSLGITDHTWVFQGPGFYATGTGVRQFLNRVSVFGRFSSGLGVVTGYGLCPSGPATAWAFNFMPWRILRLSDTAP